MAQKTWERFTPAEAKQFQMENPEMFNKYYSRYAERLYRRAKVFEKHGRTKSHGYQMIKEQLTIQNETGANAYNLSKMSSIINSKWSSYSNQRAIDKKIIATLEENFWKGIVPLNELDEFGKLMENLKDSPQFYAYGSDQLVPTVLIMMARGKEEGKSWKEILSDYIKSNDIKE